MDKLSPEVYCLIFKYVNLKDLIDCKLVCKYWNEIISNQAKVDKLMVSDENVDYQLRWYHSNELIYEEIEYCHTIQFLAQIEKSILSNLKHLRINSEIEFCQLNLFSRLVHLEISYDLRSRTIDLSLPNLEILAIYAALSSQLTIDCLKLKVLLFHNHNYIYYRYNNLDLKNAGTIKYLETDIYDDELAIFKNVECF